VAQAQQQMSSQMAMGLHMGRGLREGLMWLLFFFSLYLLISLASYSPNDPSWSYSGSGDMVRNAGGKAGAWFSDVFLYLFGVFAYLFPVMVAWSAVLVFRRRNPDDSVNVHLVALRWFGFLITLASGTALAALHFSELKIVLPLGSGGVLGQTLGAFLLESFGQAGSSLILLALFLSGFTLFTGVSWLSVMDWTGEWTLRGFDGLRYRGTGV